MASITWTDVETHAPALSTVDADAQTDILAYVNDCVNTDMFGGETASRTKLARIYLAAHMGELARLAAAGGSNGTVSSKTISATSVSVDYATNNTATTTSLDATSYGRQYQALVRANSVGYLP